MAVFSVGASAPRSSIVLFLVAAALAAGELPSCESDTAEHCLAEGADLSSEGIDACLSALGDAGRSEQCNSYLKLMANCKPDYGRGGVCEDGHMNGETAACLIQRVAPEKLSEACRNALPVKEEVRTASASRCRPAAGLGPRGGNALSCAALARPLSLDGPAPCCLLLRAPHLSPILHPARSRSLWRYPATCTLFHFP